MSDTETHQQHRETIIIGSGVAGLSAGVYAARADNNPLIIEGDEPGGQLTLTTEVANYPGFDTALSGPQLIQNMKKQATQFGADIIHGIVEEITHDTRPFVITLRNGNTYTADAVIVASGASARTLGIPGEDELFGYGVSTCATCDGAFFRDEDMVVVGGGDAACEEANFLTKFANKVYLVHRRDELRAEAYWKNQVKSNPNIEIVWNTEVTGINGSVEQGVSSVETVYHPDGKPTEKRATNGDDVTHGQIETGAVFLAIGHVPNTGFLEDTGVELDDEGYIITSNNTGEQQTATKVDGIFGAGDVVDYHYQQAITAGAMGCKAAIDVDEYLSNTEK